nr:succinylglutamate desuccinylase [Dongshaea marina]
MIAKNDFLEFTLENQCFTDFVEFIIEPSTRVQIWDSGVLLFEPLTDRPTKDIVLSSGVHGNETAPIEICSDLITQLLNKTLTVRHRVLFIFGNPGAMALGQRQVEENLNRLFSGRHSQDDGVINGERRRARKLEQYVSQFFEQNPQTLGRYHYDLHTAIRDSKQEKFAVYPYLQGAGSMIIAS